MVVSLGLVSAVWLWRRRPWGYVLVVMWNVKGAVYMAALSSAAVQAYRTGASKDIMQVALCGPIGVGCVVSFIVLLGSMESSHSGDNL